MPSARRRRQVSLTTPRRLSLVVFSPTRRIMSVSADRNISTACKRSQTAERTCSCCEGSLVASKNLNDLCGARRCALQSSVTSKQCLLATGGLAFKIATLLRPAVLRPVAVGSNDIAAAGSNSIGKWGRSHDRQHPQRTSIRCQAVSKTHATWWRMCAALAMLQLQANGAV